MILNEAIFKLHDKLGGASVSFHLGLFRGGELLSGVVSGFYTKYETAKLFQSGCAVCIPVIGSQVSSCSVSSEHGIVWVFPVSFLPF